MRDLNVCVSVLVKCHPGRSVRDIRY